MSKAVTVKVSNRYQIALPSIARKQLNIQAGDRLLVDIQEGLIVLSPQPHNYAEYLAGLHQEIWEGEIVYFEGSASGGTPPYTYTWKFGVGILPSKKRMPGETLFNYEGVYIVRLTVKDSKGRVNTDSVSIVVKRKEVF